MCLIIILFINSYFYDKLQLVLQDYGDDMSTENDIIRIIIIFRKVKMGLNSWGYEYEALATEKNGKLDNEQFGIYPLAMLDRIIFQNNPTRTFKTTIQNH